MTEERDDLRFDLLVDEAVVLRWAIDIALAREADTLPEPAEDALVQLRRRLNQSLRASPR